MAAKTAEGHGRIGNMKIVELKQELAFFGLDTRGKKPELFARLKTYLEEHELEKNEHELNCEDLDEDAFGTVPEEEEIDVLLEDDSLKEEHDMPARAEKVLVTSVSSLTPAERKKMRAERFGTPPCDEAKKAARVARFGTPLGGSGSSLEDLGRIKKRKERFGVVLGPLLLPDDEESKKRKRAERFGLM